MIRIPDFARSGRELTVRRVVVKLGSNVVMGAAGGVDEAVLDSIAGDVAALHATGARAIVVTSGAIGVACMRLGRPRPRAIPEKQAFAAIGQIDLMRAWQAAFERRGLVAAQVLLSRSDMEDRRRYLNARHALDTLLELGCVPVINENDTTATEELNFGDNDMLSAYVCVKVKGDLLVILSTVPGVLASPPDDASPAEGGAGASPPEIIPVIPRIDDRVNRWVDDSRSKNGMGGMTGKLAAAKFAAEAGVQVVIAGGKTPGILGRVLGGDFPGTSIPAERDASAISSHKRWIAFGRPQPLFRIHIDDRAVKALVKDKKSLLPVGIVSVSGEFKFGDSVACVAPDGRVVARGLVNYSAGDLRQIAGRKTSEIESVLGRRDHDEAIHRDDLVVFEHGEPEASGGDTQG